MKYYTLLRVLMALLITSFLHAQTTFNVSPCFHDELVHYQDAATPGFREALNRTYQAVLSNKNTLQTRGDEVYTIKVVFHVVYKTDEENISDQRLKDQIAVLNENYRRKNLDTANTRSIFKPLAADAKIEFKLDRVIRIKTTALFKPNLLSQTNQIPNQVKQTAEGGSDAIDPDRYLNIWICRIEPMELLGLPLGAVLGFAYPPAGLSHWPTGANAPTKNLDGVVVDYRTAGKAGLSYEYPGLEEPLSLQGRTMVHEVGHYLGLRHIWGDNSLLGISPNCDGEDGVTDTPKASNQSQFDCDQTKNSCADSPNDYPDMIENFMDYSNESCQNMFTFGQVGIMRAVLEGPRKLLISDALSKTETATQFKASISPNPTEGGIFFDWNENQPYQLTVSDAIGKVIQSTKGSNSQNLNLTAYSNGLYFFEIKSAGKFQVLKVLLNK
jgi:Pregnancy-associated plasma protein-A/Secretion system C-terminal sorting domain